MPELAKSEKASLLGFIVDCSINDTSHVQQLISSISHTMFTRAVTDSFSEDIAIASTCQTNGRTYFCGINAFNEAGKGPKSKEIVLSVPCPKNGKWNLSITRAPSGLDFLFIKLNCPLFRGCVVQLILINLDLCKCPFSRPSILKSGVSFKGTPLCHYF